MKNIANKKYNNISGELAFESFDKTYLKLSSKWLKDEEIRRLINALPITDKKQKDWFNLLHKKKDYFIWGISLAKLPIGVVGIKNVTKTTGEYWGYIGEKNYWGKGIGKKMIEFILEFAIKKKLDRIYLNVIKENTRAISLYNKMRFKVVEEDDYLLKMVKTIKYNND